MLWALNPNQRIDAFISVLCNLTLGGWGATIGAIDLGQAVIPLSVNILVASQTRSSCQGDKICVALLNLQLG